ncbi:MAG TPA: hypothetical protein VHB97_05390 [Polyangia bacterium]|nr:hypothetical protein [Polyangia bacterium]
MKWLALACVVMLPSLARAQDLKDRFNIRLIAQGMYEAEQQTAIPTGYGREAQVASPFELGYGDLRAIIDGRRLPGNFDLHLDGRVRISGNFSTDAATQGADQIISRGYLGGREYEVRQAFVRRRGETVDFALGRMIVAEADALKLDGLRLWWRMAKHWDASLYAGTYPDPYSRSLTTDYGGGFTFVGGADATYTYDKIWGSFSVNSAYLGGNDDGGALDPNAPAGTPHTETPRTWMTWTDYVRLASWLDVFSDVVFDATGAAGAQLTRLDVLATIRAGKHLTLHAGYDHLSAFAIEMYVTRLLQDRVNYLAGTIENNLIVQRTARDEVRGDADLSFGKFSLFADGRYRKRALVTLSEDPQFQGVNGQMIAPGMAYDLTAGLRDRGSLAGIRFGLWFTYLSDYRSKSSIFGFDFGRSFFDERLSIDLSFLYANTNDALANQPTTTPCNGGTVGSLASVNQGCYGTRAGAEYETGLTVSWAPSLHWFLFVDYRLVADTSGGFIVAPNAMAMTVALPQPTVLTHVLLLRIEARY